MSKVEVDLRNRMMSEEAEGKDKKTRETRENWGQKR